ncbi:hypothetical protein M0R04_11530 [Candidatus Dojkabacteria bacterium]|jgi:hypothetical protein|nr:hypothetical protein [Candidatus Dojkabacteria bacterium]
MGILIDYVISDVRKNTDNEEFNSEVGYSNEEIVRFINDGRNRLHARIVAQHSSAFVEEYEVSVTNDVESYNMPYNAYLGNKVSNVEYSRTGLSDDYYSLKRESHKLRRPSGNGHPNAYSLKANKIYLSATPNNSTGKLRISFVVAPKQLNKRRGQIIATSECSDSLSAPTFININFIDATYDETELNRDTHFCVVDKYGNLKMSNVILSSVGDAGITVDLTSYEAVLNIDSSTVFNTGDVIAQGDYIVPGKYSSSHIDEVDSIRRYIRTFAEVEVLMRDSSIDTNQAQQMLGTIEKEIVDSYADTSDDIDYIPEINTDWGY